MKIVITGGGSGGHFYPLISVADKVRELSDKKKILQPKIYYFSIEEYDKDILFKNDIKFVKIIAGKLRLNFEIKNILSIIKMGIGVIKTFFIMFRIYPDVVFTNGGFVSFPTLFAAKILRIPVVIHVSDTVPSRVLILAGKFANKISIAFDESAKYFDKKKVALLGNPIRDEIKNKQIQGSHEFFNFNPEIKTILILGGSQGSQKINDVILRILPSLLKKYQIIHQTGKNNFDDAYRNSSVELLDNADSKNYKIFSYFSYLEMRKASGIADLVISRAGAGSINEISKWEIPAILIPISKEVSRDQDSNALAYARTGASVIINQKNLTSNILKYEVERLISDEKLLKKMSVAAKNFYRPDAAVKIAEEILNILLSHQE